MVDDHDVVGESFDFVEFVGGEHHAGAGVAQFVHHGAHKLASVGVDAGGGLVEEHDVGLPDERERQRRTLLLPAGEAPPRRAGDAAGQPDALEQLGDRRRGLVVRREQRQCGSDAHRRVDAAALQHHAEPRQQGAGIAYRVEAVHAHRAGRRAAITLDRFDRRCFPGAVGTEQRGDGARVRGERQPVDCGDVAEAHREVLDGNCVHCSATLRVTCPMLDIRRLRTDLDAVKASLATKNVDPSEVDAAVELDTRVRALQSQRDELRAQVKTLSAEVGKARKAGDTTAADAAQQQSRELGEHESKLAAETAALEAELRDRMLRIPNTPDPAALVGKSEDDNQVVRSDADARVRRPPTRAALGHRRRARHPRQRTRP